MDAMVVVLGLLVVPSLVAALVVLVVGRGRRGRGAVPDQDAAVRAAVDHLVRVNQEMLAGERRLGAAELDGTRTLIDHELVEVRGELHALTALIQGIERDRREHAGALSGQLAEAGRSTRALAETTQSLREALVSTTARGQWGERMADDVLRLAGFVDGVNYRRHQKLAGSGQVPDYTFLLPDGLVLHMDVKFPLSNYLRYLDASGDVERERYRREFLKDVRLRLREVTTRDYVDPSANTVDCVLLFIPNEQVYAFIQEQDRALLDDALREKVVFCSPLTLFAVLAVVRQAVDNFRLSQTSHEILVRLHGFEQQWAKFVDQMEKAGRSVRSAAQSFDELEGTRRRGVERELDRIAALRRQEGLEDDADAPAVALALEG
ncbi:MAG: DNA recombination protein RmuC [Acidimicrobiia bacterium]